jgi:outer membrane biosynthesis protein TonB
LDDLVQIAAAQTQPAVVQEPVIELVPEVVVAVVEEKKPKKKAAAKKTAEPVAAAADEPLNITNELVPETFIATEPVKEKAAPKRKSQPKKAAAAKTDTPVLEDVVISGTDIEVSPITIDGKTYFMDESSNLYAHPIPSASSIGKYNPLTRKITHN